MISLEESFPKKGENYLLGQDVIWSQFNDINFYVEDIDQENFYLQVLRKLFPAVKLNRIFPLGGKDIVITEAKKSLRNKRKVFLLDLDFDEILNRKEVIKNVFYLKKYSIENYLLDNDGIYELIREENPKIKTVDIKAKFNLSDFANECYNLFNLLSCHFLIINKYELGLNYLKIEPHRDCDFTNPNCCIKPTVLNPFFNLVENELRSKKPRLKYSTQINNHKKYFNTATKCLINTPGKYLINLLKIRLKKLFSFCQTSMETFVYRLTKNCGFTELDYLRVDILRYIS